MATDVKENQDGETAGVVEELGDLELEDITPETIAETERKIEDLQIYLNEKNVLIEQAYYRYDNATEKCDNLREGIEERKIKLKVAYDKIIALEEAREEILQQALDNETLRITMINCSETSRRGRKKLSAAMKQSDMVEVQKALQDSFGLFQEDDMKIDITETQLKSVHARKRISRRKETQSMALEEAGSTQQIDTLDRAEERLIRARAREFEGLEKERLLRKKLIETKRKIRTCQRQIRNTWRELKATNLQRNETNQNDPK